MENYITETTEFNPSLIQMPPYIFDKTATQSSVYPKYNNEPIVFIVDFDNFTGGIPNVDLSKTHRNHINKCMRVYIQLKSSDPSEREFIKKLKLLNKYVKTCCANNKTPTGEAFITRKQDVHKGKLTYASFLKISQENNLEAEADDAAPELFDETIEGNYYMTVNIPTKYEKDADEQKEKELTLLVQENMVKCNITKLDELREYVRKGTKMVMAIKLKKFWIMKDTKCSLAFDVCEINILKRAEGNVSASKTSEAMQKYLRQKGYVNTKQEVKVLEVKHVDTDDEQEEEEQEEEEQVDKDVDEELEEKRRMEEEERRRKEEEETKKKGKGKKK